MKNLLAHFIFQREMARVNHDKGGRPPFCEDPIINTYRFCNVRREDDKVTRWLKKNWRDPHIGHSNMTGAMLLARMVNWPPTLAAIGFPEEWKPDEVADKIRAVRGKMWSSAYMITTCGKKMDKVDYVVGKADEVMTGCNIKPVPGMTLNLLWQRLCTIDGLGAGFIAAQVIADLKYSDPYAEAAPDWWTFAVPGPGSRRGVNRYFKFGLNEKLSDLEWTRHLRRIINDVEPLVNLEPRLHAQDWQNVMCEFDKYVRARTGEGRPRARYKAQTDYTI
jgi:hypothetical protein